MAKMNATVWILMLVLTVLTAWGMDECGDEVAPSSACMVTTAVVSCGTYDLYNHSGDLVTDDGVMSQLGSTGIYNFTFSQSNVGRYTILLCQGDVAVINVNASTLDARLDEIIRGISSNATWVTNNINASVLVNTTDIALNVWGYNLTSYNLSSDFDSAGAYLRASEVFRYG